MSILKSELMRTYDVSEVTAGGIMDIAEIVDRIVKRALRERPTGKWIQVSDFKHIPGENDAEYIKLLQEHISRQDAIIRKAIAKLKIGCTGCVHYDQRQTALICHDCKRYYQDLHKEWSGE